MASSSPPRRTHTASRHRHPHPHQRRNISLLLSVIAHFPPGACRPQRSRTNCRHPHLLHHPGLAWCWKGQVRGLRVTDPPPDITNWMTPAAPTGGPLVAALEGPWQHQLEGPWQHQVDDPWWQHQLDDPWWQHQLDDPGSTNWMTPAAPTGWPLAALSSDV